MSFQLDSILAKELYKDVLVRLVHGKDLTLNYFELKSKNVDIPSHEHPMEHLVVVLDGTIEFMFNKQNILVKKNGCLFVPARKRHTARVIESPVKALEIYNAIENEYYNR